MNSACVLQIPGKSGLMFLSFRFRDLNNRVKVYSLSYRDDDQTELLSDVGRTEGVDIDDCGFHEILHLVKEYDI